MKVEAKNIRLPITATQGAANTDKVVSSILDPYDRKSGIVIRAVEFFLAMSGVSTIAADAVYLAQLSASSAAEPTAPYSAGSGNAICATGFAVSLTTSGVAAIEYARVWNPPDGADIIVGAEYLSLILSTAGFTGVAGVTAVVYGDAVTLTSDEIATSRLRFV
jgi:hypothetical protein